MKKKAIVLGLGISGKSAAHFLLRLGFAVYAFDDKKDKKEEEGVQHLLQKGMHLLSFNPSFGLKAIEEEMPASFLFAVISPGFPPDHPILQYLSQNHVEIMGEIELAAKFLQNKVVGITGTNGKTTVTKLVDHLLQGAGIKSVCLGNIGKPLTSEVETMNLDTVIVLELSSFQLETMSSKILDAAVILNITPDHLDRYASMKEYAEAKIRIKECLKTPYLFLEEEIEKEYKDLLGEFPYVTYGWSEQSCLYSDKEAFYWKGKKLFTLPDSYKEKSHHVENLMGAYLICRHLGVSDSHFLEGLKTFTRPEHRIEWVAEKNGVVYINDSKGTNIDATERAVESLEGNILLIAGGVHKGSSYKSWVEGFRGKVQSIFAIGEAAPLIEKELSPYFTVIPCLSMEEAVEKASKKAKRGEIVLLSPGCSSFDMFKDYSHRGAVFKEIVKNI